MSHLPCMGRWGIVTSSPTLLVAPLACTFLCTINIGDHVEHQHNIGKVEAGGIGVQIMQPGTSSIARPKENDYNGVREYIEQRKAQDAVFKTYCKSHTRKQICERLSDEFGWTVDAHNLGVNIGRNR